MDSQRNDDTHPSREQMAERLQRLSQKLASAGWITLMGFEAGELRTEFTEEGLHHLHSLWASLQPIGFQDFSQEEMQTFRAFIGSAAVRLGIIP